MAHMKDSGKVGITVELGGRSATSPTEFARVGRELANSILNILRHYTMYPGAAAYPSPRYKGQQEALLAHEREMQSLRVKENKGVHPGVFAIIVLLLAGGGAVPMAGVQPAAASRGGQSR